MRHTPVDRLPTRAVPCAPMKKRASKKKSTARPVAAKRKTGGAKPKKSAAKKPAAKAAGAATVKPTTPYTPAPIKGDGWPPFRYPLQ